MKPPVPTLFFDTATTTGWAYGDAIQGKRQWGHFTLPRTGEELAPYLVAMEHAVRDLVVRFDPIVVAYESPLLNRRGHADHVLKLRKLYGLANKVEEVAYAFNRVCREASLGDIRRHFLGRAYPRESKRAKIAVCNRCRALGWDVATDDEADALAGLDYMLALNSPAGAIARTPLFMAQADGG